MHMRTAGMVRTTWRTLWHGGQKSELGKEKEERNWKGPGTKGRGETRACWEDELGMLVCIGV
jgi:hypothetical protein